MVQLIVVKKTPRNLTVPDAVWSAFDKLHEDAGLNEKQKWAAVTAGLVMLIESPVAVRNFYIGEVLGTVGESAAARLLSRAAGGSLRRQADSEAAPEFNAVLDVRGGGERLVKSKRGRAAGRVD